MMFKDANTNAVEFPKAAVAAMNVELAQITALLEQADLTAVDGFSQIPQALQRMLSICSVYAGPVNIAGMHSQFPPPSPYPMYPQQPMYGQPAYAQSGFPQYGSAFNQHAHAAYRTPRQTQYAPNPDQREDVTVNYNGRAFRLAQSVRGSHQSVNACFDVLQRDDECYATIDFAANVISLPIARPTNENLEQVRGALTEVIIAVAKGAVTGSGSVGGSIHAAIAGIKAKALTDFKFTMVDADGNMVGDLVVEFKD